MGVIHKYIRDTSKTLVLAIDDPKLDLGEVINIIKSTNDVVAAYKVGLPFIIHYGIRQTSILTREFPDLYFIADLKLADIGPIMRLSIEEIGRAGFKGVVAHAVVGISGALDEVVSTCRNLGVDLILQLNMSNSGSIATIDKLSPEMKEIVSSLDPEGLIIAANKSEVIRDIRTSLGWRHIILAPGIMISGTYPGEALCSGADAEVIGRLVLSSPNPRKAVTEVMGMQKEFLRKMGDKCVGKSV